jgi:hypothetical protein
MRQQNRAGEILSRQKRNAVATKDAAAPFSLSDVDRLQFNNIGPVNPAGDT